MTDTPDLTKLIDYAKSLLAYFYKDTISINTKKKQELINNLIENFDYTDSAGIIASERNFLRRCDLIQLQMAYLENPEFVLDVGFSAKQSEIAEKANARYTERLYDREAELAAQSLQIDVAAIPAPEKLKEAPPEYLKALNNAASIIETQRTATGLFCNYNIARSSIYHIAINALRAQPETRKVAYGVNIKEAAALYFFAINHAINPFEASGDGVFSNTYSEKLAELYESFHSFYFAHDGIKTTRKLIEAYCKDHPADSGKISPEAARTPLQPEEWSKILQGKPINSLMTVANTDDVFTQDKISETLKANVNGVEVILDGDLSSISGQALKVLIILLEILTRQLPHKDNNQLMQSVNSGRRTKITLSDYMKQCELSDRTSAKAQLLAAVAELYHVSLEWPEWTWEVLPGKKRAEKVLKHHQMRITDHTITDDDLTVKHGAIEFIFSYDLAVYLSNAYIMHVPAKLFAINTRLHPYSVQFCWKLLALRNMNDDKKNQSYTYVQTLLQSALSMPAYEDISKKGQILQRIVKPFDRDLKELVDKGILSEYWYITPDGTRIKGGDGEFSPLFALSYSDFSKLKVFFLFSNYPSMENVRRKKQARITAQKRKSRITSGGKESPVQGKN